MPAHLANTDPFKQVPETIGSGPFKFVKDEWIPGVKVVYIKNEDYLPRSEPASFAAGGKVDNVDRVECLYIPDPATAMNALIAGEIDFFEGDNDGLVMAELEVLSTDHEFVRPDWLGRDVTEDGRFGNGSLARDPWIDFRDDV